MKKVSFALAMVSLLLLSSCEEGGSGSRGTKKESCYAITATVTIMGQSSSGTSYVRTTKEDLDDAVNLVKQDLMIGGVTESMIKISTKEVPDTNCK